VAAGGISELPDLSPARTGLSDLKARIRRREKELDAEQKKQPEVKKAVFVVFATSHFRAKTLGGYVQRMGFSNVVLCSEPQGFVKSLLNTVNDASVEKIAIAVYNDSYTGIQALLTTPEMEAVKQKLPKLSEAPVFAVLKDEQTQTPPEGINPAHILTMRTSPEFNGKRIAKVLDVNL
jgi:hypothetical protein